ncbi:protein ALP1-like isoform X1 [Setaria italica]|nr:protein ALP1-like isoform X1 [Setaria italica]
MEESSSEDETMELILHCRKRNREFVQMMLTLGMYYESYIHKAPRRVASVTGIEWVTETLSNPTSCYNMFRMSCPLFNQLHDLLVDSYGLRATRDMSTVEALGMFLWILGAPQSLRQVEDRFVRSLETISRTFDKVLGTVLKLAVHNIRPQDPEFKTVHKRLLNPRFAPYFNNCIGAIDGTHVPVVVPSEKVMQYTNRHGYTSQNVLAICDFDMRFTFVVSGWPGSVHDMRVFSDAIEKYGDKFPHPPTGKFYLVDSGYPNRPGYLSPYKGTKYHLPEFRNGPMPRGMQETFNYAHSSLRNVIERSFGVLKMKWRILMGIPSFPMHKQSKIIVACMAIHNFIRENSVADREFDLYDCDENGVPMPGTSNRGGGETSTQVEEEDSNMNAFRDEIAHALYNRSR